MVHVVLSALDRCAPVSPGPKSEHCIWQRRGLNRLIATAKGEVALTKDITVSVHRDELCLGPCPSGELVMDRPKTEYGVRFTDTDKFIDSPALHPKAQWGVRDF